MNQLEEDDLHREILVKAEQAHTADFENRQEALDDLRFRAGGAYQWDLTTLRERQEDGRPCITVNMIPHYVRQVTNDARANKQAVKVRPVDDEGDKDIAEVLEGITRHIEDQSESASKVYVPCIDNAATCGIANFRILTKWDEDDPFCQNIYIKNIPDALAVLWDPFAKSPDRSDANWCFVIEDIPEAEYEKRYPDKPISDFSLADTAMFWRDQGTKTVRIAEYWCKEPVTKKMGRTQDGKVIDLTGIPAPSVKFLGITEQKDVESFKIVSYIVSGQGILKGPQPWAGKYIPVVAVIGEEVWIGEHRIRSGLVRHAKDPQRLYNLWRSLQAEVLATQPKTPYIGTATQFEKFKAIWSQANRRNVPFLPFTPDPLHPGAPARAVPPQGSKAITEEAMISIDEMKATTGIYDAALGNRSNETSGIGIEARKKESDTSNAHFSDNLSLSIRQCGRILIDLIPSVWDTEKQVRLLNEDGTHKMAWINKLVQTPEGPKYIHDLSQGRYDVTVKTGPSFATRRQETVGFLLQFMQTMPDSAHFVADLLAKNLDDPGSEELAKRFRILLAKTNPELFPEGTGEPLPPPTQQDQNNALMAHIKLTQEAGKAQLIEAQAEEAEMQAALTGAQVHALAMGDPMSQMAEQAVMNVLQRMFGGAQQAPQGGQPTAPQPGPDQAQQPPQPAVAPHIAPFVQPAPQPPAAPMGAQ